MLLYLEKIKSIILLLATLAIIMSLLRIYIHSFTKFCNTISSNTGFYYKFILKN